MVDFIAPNTGPADPDDITTDAFEFLQNQFPEWEPNDNNLEVWQIMALARIVSIATQVAGTVPLEIFKYFGQSIIGLQPVGALAAITTTTWTMIDNAGYTIPAGTNVAFQTSGNTSVAFETVDDVIVPPGSTVTATGGVQIIAVDAGSQGNGLGPSGIVLLDALAFVSGIVAEAETTGGVDAESDTQYAARLAAELQLSSPTPILGTDFGVMARNVTGVFRAVGVDNYNPADGTTNNQRMVAVAAVDATGAAVSSGIKTAIHDYLQSLRETNFIVNTFDPTYTTVNIVFNFTAFSTFDAASVLSAATLALENFLNPAMWGVDPNDTTLTSWTNTPTVRYNSVVGILLAVPGLRWVNSLTINGVAADLALSGKAPLPAVGTIAGTAS
jgi:hypothetical protein